MIAIGQWLIRIKKTTTMTIVSSTPYWLRMTSVPILPLDETLMCQEKYATPKRWLEASKAVVFYMHFACWPTIHTWVIDYWFCSSNLVCMWAIGEKLHTSRWLMDLYRVHVPPCRFGIVKQRHWGVFDYTWVCLVMGMLHLISNSATIHNFTFFLLFFFSINKVSSDIETLETPINTYLQSHYHLRCQHYSTVNHRRNSFIL